ncbi:MAG: 30S ribosomal protein S6--L-glutamate ligase, partial [Myxococcota bacterium]
GGEGDGKVLGAMSRTAADGDFRSNLHLGGSAERAVLTREARDISAAAAKLFGLRVAGVDLLMSARGPLITEVNPSPGLEGIENITGLDIAKSIVRTVESLVVATRRGEKF